jgi:S-formylglutathione hydrolase FrmB
MNLGQMQMYSPVLRRHVTFSFRLPARGEVGPGPYPALLQLHGASEDHTAWITRTMLPVHLEGTPLLVVMPEGARSQWLNRNPHERYEDFLVRDLLPACAEFFPVRPGRWAIGGLSMGGQGALHLGLKYPDRFASIYAHSSVIPNRETLRRWLPDLTPDILDDADLLARAARCVARPDRPRLSFDCGTEDPLLSENRAFHRHLERIGYPHHYAEHPGGHTWAYWDEHVRAAIRQHLEVFLDRSAV